MKNYVGNWVTKSRQLDLGLAEKQKLRDLADLFADYDRLTPMERLTQIEKAKKMISNPKVDIKSEAASSRIEETIDLPLFANVQETKKQPETQDIEVHLKYPP
ncbi:MAG: hypothetical protein NZ961_00105, partial [Candidatus Poribacteria bacterium]|nr:hypothetical protein [Candidatus Poribacteria bacterium]